MQRIDFSTFSWKKLDTVQRLTGGDNRVEAWGEGAPHSYFDNFLF